MVKASLIGEVTITSIDGDYIRESFLEVTITSSGRHKFFCFIFGILAILHHLETIFQFLSFL